MPLPSFRPVPWLANPHVQTILGAYLPGRSCPAAQRRHAVPLGDGDRLLLHENVPRRWREGWPAALLVHGLTGSHRSGHIVRIASRLLAQGVRVFRIDLRGAGDGVALARLTYHAGRSDDLRAALAFIHRLCPASPLWLCALSLGGNAALKLAGESAADPVPGLARVASLNAPIDMERCSALLARPANRAYEKRFVAGLMDNARQRQRHFPRIEAPPWPRTLRAFDDSYTAPRNGFADAAEYYRAASAAPWVARSPVPTLVLTARDDPFIDPEPFDRLVLPPHVERVVTSHGGHIGYLGPDGAGGWRWGERFVAEWLRGQA